MEEIAPATAVAPAPILIWKYRLRHVGTTTMQQGAVILDAQVQDGVVVLWAAVRPDAPKVERKFWIAETGDAYPLNHVYVATLQLSNGQVWHLFDGGM